MTFNDNASLNTGQIDTGGGGGGGMGGGMMIGGGGGILGIIAFVLYLLFGGQSNSTSGTALDPSQVTATGSSSNSSLTANCKTGADANRDENCRVVGTVNSVQDYWSTNLPKYTNNKYKWQSTRTMLYSGQVQSACGTASNQVGPFYCPLDKRVYIDTSFFQVLDDQFGGSTGALAQEYVVAHEYGHAVEDQLGVLDAAQQSPQGATSGSVRIELMADCLAGMWISGASSTTDSTGQALLQAPTQEQLQDALNAASTVGDDNIEKKTTGRVTPENFTHGTSAQRMRWLTTGMQATSINQCNTLNATSL